MKKWPTIALLVVGAFIGATILSGPIATAAQEVGATIIGPLDGQGNVKVHEQGTANVNVVGKVSAQAAIPATQFSVVTGTADPGVNVLLGPEAGTSYALTSLSVDNNQDTSVVVELSGNYGPVQDCDVIHGFDVSDGPGAIVPPHDTVSMTFPQPFVIEAKQQTYSCLDALVFRPGPGAITVVGYRF
jgi:hypothetical protein